MISTAHDAKSSNDFKTKLKEDHKVLQVIMLSQKEKVKQKAALPDFMYFNLTRYKANLHFAVPFFCAIVCLY